MTALLEYKLTALLEYTYQSFNQIFKGAHVPFPES